MSVEILLKAALIQAIWQHKKCQQPGLWLYVHMSVEILLYAAFTLAKCHRENVRGTTTLALFAYVSGNTT